MGTNIQDVYICQQERTTELSRRNYQRNLATTQLTPKYFSRPVSNRRVVMPMMDFRKKSQVVKGKFDKYNMEKDFNPGMGGPYHAYSDNVDKESALFNRFAPLQRCPQNSFIPSTDSDLYNLMGPSPNVANTQFSLLQHVDTHPPFNPDSCGTEKELFFNHTRQQLKNIKV